MRPSTRSSIGSIQKSYAWLPTIGQAAGRCLHVRDQCEHPLKYQRSTDRAGGSWHSSPYPEENYHLHSNENFRSENTPLYSTTTKRGLGKYEQIKYTYKTIKPNTIIYNNTDRTDTTWPNSTDAIQCYRNIDRALFGSTIQPQQSSVNQGLIGSVVLQQRHDRHLSYTRRDKQS